MPAPTFTNRERPLQITTPLGEDALFITSLRAEEAVSKLFHFEAELVADGNDTVAFERILGQSVTISLRLHDGTVRYFNGVVQRFTQGDRDVASEDTTFLRFRADIVPELWFLTRRRQTRIFQQLSVPEILSRV